MKGKRYKKSTNKQKANVIIKKIKYYLYYEKKTTERLMVKNSKAVELFFELEGIVYDRNTSLANFLISLKESRKYPVLIKRRIRPRNFKTGDHREKYLNYLQSQEWQDKRQEVFNLRGRECERCGKDLNRKRADVHHKTYENLFKERMEDLEVLCRPCHEDEHNGKRKRGEVKRYKRNGVLIIKEVPTIIT
ncbi:MAG: HNH endonuclease [Colwellia sp.]|nr:HNH endonuclease [Colwellia sp.]